MTDLDFDETSPALDGLNPYGRGAVRFIIHHTHVTVSRLPIEDLISRIKLRGEGRPELFRFQAVVSSDDTEFSMTGGVSRAILGAAGAIAQDEAKRQMPVRLADVIVTSAGALPLDYIFHCGHHRHRARCHGQ
jgi:hypothetical protein